MEISLGQQHLAEFYGCSVDRINNRASIRDAMIEAARLAKATVVAEVFHDYNPQGISGVVVIAESHIAVHSWPEHRCVSVDIFTCSPDMDPIAAVDYLKLAFKAETVTVKVIDRGQVKNRSVRQHRNPDPNPYPV